MEITFYSPAKEIRIDSKRVHFTVSVMPTHWVRPFGHFGVYKQIDIGPFSIVIMRA